MSKLSIFMVIIVVLCIASKKQSGIENNQNNRALYIPFNQQLDRPLGLPFETGYSNATLCISENDTIKQKYGEYSFEFTMLNDTLTFLCSYDKGKKNAYGEFVIPKTACVSNRVSFDPETYDPVVVFSEYYTPVRCGLWLFVSDSSYSI